MPLAMSTKLWKNSDRSRSRSMPVTRFRTENRIPPPRPNTFSPIRPGRRKNCSERESTKRDSRSRASRKSSALRLRRGVGLQQFQARLGGELVEVLDRQVVGRARHRVGELLVDAVAQDRVARLLV